MSIDVSCPTCDKSYKVKDEAGGKKLRCKECQTLIPIPEAAVEEADPWEGIDEQAQEDWDGGDDEEAGLPPVVRTSKKKKPAKVSRAYSGDGMPPTIIVALCINGLILAANIFGIGSALAQAGQGGRTGGGVLRIIVGISILRGLVNRSDRTRRNSIMLDIIGLVFVGILGAVLLARDGAPQAGGIDKATLFAIFGAQAVLWVADMVVLMSQSARDYCNQ